MTLLSLQDITLGYGGPPLLTGVNFRIEAGERVCLVGRNGEGKSSLLRIVAGELLPDTGSVIKRQGLRIAGLGQEIPRELKGTVRQVVAEGLGEKGELVERHRLLSEKLARTQDRDLLDELAAVEQKIDQQDGWQARQQVDATLSRLSLDGDSFFEQLSGGMKRRVLLARALAADPELLLLDEPTNHLDIEAIGWLEDFLLSSAITLLFVTHDRSLLRRLATRIVDLDRGLLTSWPGDYDTYLRRKEEQLSAAASLQAKFDRKLAQEEIWIRQGIKARRTRNEGRVRALVEMRRERKARREQLGRVRMEIGTAGLSGKVVAILKEVSFAYGGKIVIDNLSTAVLRGDRIGIIGPNGVGKTTLLRLLTGDLQPTGGSIRLGTNLEINYFDQQRTQLDPDRTVLDNLGEGSDTITINGQRRHLIGYLQDFLFTPDRARSPVSVLSGGERNRLLLARLFARPCNLLVLDEPTNDLDMETLELLEELLQQFEGTVLLVSHDRAFLNNVVTSTLVFEGAGKVQEYAGGYDDWLQQRPSVAVPIDKKKTAGKKALPKTATRPRKLTFKEARELEDLPGRIEQLEQEQHDIYAAMADPAFYQNSGDQVAATKARLEELEGLLSAVYSRWEELESIKEGQEE